MLSIDDKEGGSPYLEYLLQGFRETTDEFQLQDLPLSENIFTWE